MEGGTVLTVQGTNLGVSFIDIQGSILTVGSQPCTPMDVNYFPGRQFVCEIPNLLTPGPKELSLTIGARVATVTADPFVAVEPIVSSVFPSLGPVAGGTVVSVRGSGLGIGNKIKTVVNLELSETIYSCNVMYVKFHDHFAL